MLNRTWVEINLDNLSHNYHQLKNLTDKKTKIIGVIKANAYGHGVFEVAKTLLKNNIDYLAVATLDEAIELRCEGINIPILVLGYVEPPRSREIIEYNLVQTLYDIDAAKVLSETALKMSKQAKIHLKIDTGMTRLGIRCEKYGIKKALEIANLKNIIVEGIYSHFATADENDDTYTRFQFENFINFCNELESSGLSITLKHISNSAAAIKFKHMHLDMIRPGISLYGCYPSDEVDRNLIHLKPCMQLKTRIERVETVPEGTGVSYGITFKTKRTSRLATIPVGYADGFTRMLSGKAYVLINGQRAPVVGRICMDHCIIDATDIEGEVKIGDEVVLFGKQKNAEITIDEVAKWLGTINYEIICMIGKRVPRIYIENGKLVSEKNYLIQYTY